MKLTPERIPPHSEESEKGVLGCILLDYADRSMDICDKYQITETSFYVSAHATIFRSIKEVMATGKQFDAVALIEYMRDQGDLDRCGGFIYLNTLVDDTPTSAHAEMYVSEVAKREKLRSIITQCRSTEAQCFDSGDDPDAVLDQYEATLGEIASQSPEQKQSWKDSTEASITNIENILSTGRGLAGLSTGFIDLDRATLGLAPQELIILAARPSQGKTAAAMNIAENVARGIGDPARETHPVGIFSLEMSQESLTTRMICGAANVSWFQFVRGGCGSEAQLRMAQAAANIKDLPLICDDTPALDVMQLRLRAKRMHKRHGIKLIVIDYLQLLRSESKAKHGKQEETADISSQLKAMAKELNIPVLALSQLSRIQNDPLERPHLSNLRDSGAIEQDADLVMFLRRPSMYPKDDDFEDNTMANVTIAKHRNGKIGKVVLNFDDSTTRFSDRAEVIDEAIPAASQDRMNF